MKAVNKEPYLKQYITSEGYQNITEGLKIPEVNRKFRIKDATCLQTSSTFSLLSSRKSHAGLNRKIFQDTAKKADAFLQPQSNI